MIRSFLIFCLIFCHSQLQAQEKDKTWVAFWDEAYDLRGFKDADGNVVIPPKFMGFTVASQFDEVIAVMEEANGQFISYHLSKSGNIFGKDSLYISDNSADCESEGFIRFEANEKVGMFNRHGEIVIPAEYNALSRVMNGLVIALKGAKKSFWDKMNHSGCNHFSWKGGETILIDTANNILIKDFEKEKQLDFYSLEKTYKKTSDPTRLNYKAEDGFYYSFIDKEMAFKSWLHDSLLSELTIQKLLIASNDTLFYWDDIEGWVEQSKHDYLKSQFDDIKNSLLTVKNPSTDYFISLGDLVIFNEHSSVYNKYFNNCGQAKTWRFPLFTIVINSSEKDKLTQDHISFLKTDGGYQLINVTLRNP
ncbi:WG repeat-containing protein [Marivirga lumbricoides]|uniref:WG repeat-containing protein n=1 Tax=Marivirga lumbricoides TaxID=1046115 RepID=UPI00166CF5F0